MEIRVLGPMEASHDGESLRLGGPKQRLVLAVLCSRVNQVVSTGLLVDDVWGDTAPVTARPTVQAYISTLRSMIEPVRPGTLTARPGGYIVGLDEDSFDVLRFDRLAAEGRSLVASDPALAVSTLREAEGLWRGDAYGDLSGVHGLRPEVTRLHELRLATVEARIDAELAIGRHAVVVPELEALVDRHPLREGLRAQLMTALYRSGRQSEALRVYQRTRRVLGEELGIEPSVDLQHLEEQILTHDTALASGAAADTPIVPEVHYATTPDGIAIAHYTIGTGGPDMVHVPGWVSNLETIWEHDLPARFLLGLASFSRLTCFDKRGTGLSDRVPVGELPNLETRSNDISTILDAAGIEDAILFGASEGGPIAAQFAVTHPERTTALILYGSYATRRPSPDYPWAPTPAARTRWLNHIEQQWGGDIDLRTLAPSMQNDTTFRTWWSRYLRSGASPSAVAALGRMNTDIDIRPIVASITVPTLILHRTGDQDNPIEGSRWLAKHIPNAQLVELAGDDHMPHINPDDIHNAIHAFIEEHTPHTNRRT